MINQNQTPYTAPLPRAGEKIFLSPAFWFADPAAREEKIRPEVKQEVTALSARWKEICEANTALSDSSVLSLSLLNSLDKRL